MVTRTADRSLRRSRAIDSSLESAFRQLGRTGGDVDLPDIIDYADAAVTWPERRARLKQNIENNLVDVSHVEVVDLPKDRINVRPLSRLDLDQRLVYEALVFSAASTIQRSIPRKVFSYRWWDRESRLLAPKSAWLRMQQQARRYHLRNPHASLARTDVTSFYENIEIETLLHELDNVNVEEATIASLKHFLESLNQLSNIWGLPQGSAASGILSNVYLLPVDFLLAHMDFYHVRYSDDSYIFGRDWASLRDGVIELSKTLRNRRLSLAASKTNIFPEEEVERELRDAAKDAVHYGLRHQLVGSQGALRQYFRKSTEREAPSSRDIRFCLNRLSATFDPYGLEWCLGNMPNHPDAAKEISRYLAAASDEKPEVRTRLADLMASDELKSYPYVEQHLLVAFMGLKYCPRGIKAMAWRRLLDRNTEGFLREMSARYLGRCVAPGEANRLKQTFQHEPSVPVRRSLLVACYESKQTSDNWLTAVAASRTPLDETAKYLKNRPSNIPLPYAEKAVIV